MQKLTVFNAMNKPTELEKLELVRFLHTNLEQYGDPKEQILHAIDYAIKDTSSFGGFVLVVKEGKSILGAVVINQTGMAGYIPENILVYIATGKKARGRGIGKKLMGKALELSHGDIALHVEADNPAVHLYTKFGFTNPYLEMRLKR